MIRCDGRPVTVAHLDEVYAAAVRRWRRRVGRKGTRFPGICEHARRLGVNRIHLYYVLTGARRSPRIEAYARENIRAAVEAGRRATG